MDQSIIYKINIKNQKNKNSHPIYEIQKFIESLYITRYKLIKNIYVSKNKEGFYLISQNNMHYEQITSIMKKLIGTIKNVKYFNLNIIDNICLSNYNLYYDKNDKYNNYKKYRSKKIKITESLYFCINDFIYYIIYILKNKNKEFNRDKYLLKLLELYKIVNYNLNIVNKTLDNQNLKYVPNTEFTDLNKKLLLIIKTIYNGNYKVKIKNLEMDNHNAYNNKIHNECVFMSFIDKNICFKTEPDTNTSTLRNKISLNKYHSVSKNTIKNKINCNYPIKDCLYKNIRFIKFKFKTIFLLTKITIINYKKRLKIYFKLE